MKTRFLNILILLFLIGNSWLRAQDQIGTVIATGPTDHILPADGPFPIGFSYTFFGNTYSNFYVSANGLVMFTDPNDLFDIQVTIPNASAPNNYIAPFWDKLSVLDGGSILYKTIGAAPDRKCVIQFKNMAYDPYIPLGTFSVILYETSNKIQIQYRQIVDPYLPMSHGLSATIGIENATGSAGVLYAFESGTAVYTGDAISFTPAGSTYTPDSNALYDNIYLAKSNSPWDPGIATLTSPAEDAVIGTSQRFEWNAASSATAYYLYIDTLSSLATADLYFAGLNTYYDVSPIALDKVYYWAVYSYNTTATTWSETRRFSTVVAPPLAAVPQTVSVEQPQDKTIKLNYTGGNASAKSAIITSLPLQGQLYQYNSGSRGTLINSVSTTVTDANMNVIYAPSGGTGNGAGNFKFKITDSGGESPEATITVNVSPPGVPNVLYVAKNTGIEIQLDKTMSDPAGKQNQFTVTVGGSPVTISSASLKTGDPYTILLTLATPLSGGESVTVSYTQGNITATTGGYLFSFNSTPVTLLAQTIDFSQAINKKYGDPPFHFTATASSGLTISYTSSNLSVMTVAATIATIVNTGTTDITAQQNGNATYAPAKYIRTITIGKGDQTITFAAIPVKTFGDPDFNVTPTASSGLPVTLVSDNLSVATVTGNTIHITGTGTANITASQPGDTHWNPASPVVRALTVSKVNQFITFNPLPIYRYGDSDFPINATASSGLPVTFSSSDPLVVTVSGNVVHIVGGGTAFITASQAGNQNYNAATPVQQTADIQKVDIIFRADNKTRKYNEANPAFTYTVSGFIFGETASVLNNLPSIGTSAVSNSDAGTYPITFTGGSDNCYNYLFVNGTLTIGKAEQNITFTDLPENINVTESKEIVAVSTSGLDVILESLDPDIATISGTTLTGVSRGNVRIKASHPGDNNWFPDDTTVTIQVQSSHANIMNLFTPNSDGFNDYWELPELDAWGKCEVRIYSRSGKLIFSDDNYSNRWDGTSGGKPVPEGPYYYIIKTANAGTIKGTLNIVR